MSELLACFTLLSGRESIDTSDTPTATSLDWRDLSDLGGDPPLDLQRLREFGNCGLCDSQGPRSFLFAHRQLAEYLAGRKIATLPLHQSRRLLASSLGWQAGVAGPLRETAAFAAMESPKLAQWIAECDPELVGMSDVADDSLRKLALRGWLDKIRRREVTSEQFRRGRIDLSGFRYPGIEGDLRPMLQERDVHCEDVLECIVEIIEALELRSLGDDLAALVLDSNAPVQARKRAGYALRHVGTTTHFQRLIPLISNVCNDPNWDLKGLALEYNWPDRLTIHQLLDSMLSKRPRGGFGPYDGFLYRLDKSGFDATSDRVAGLEWAKGVVGTSRDFESEFRIAKRIAIASVNDLHIPEIAASLASLLMTSADVYGESPLTPPKDAVQTDPKALPILANNPRARRILLDAIAMRVRSDAMHLHIGHVTPSPVLIEDFSWLLQRAADPSLPIEQREFYVEMTRGLGWWYHAECVDAWLDARSQESLASILDIPLFRDLDSKEADEEKRAYFEARKWDSPRKRPKVVPSPATRVREVLRLCEKKDAAYFFNLCNELTLTEESAEYGFARDLRRSPGWISASPETKLRIVSAAKRLLDAPSDVPRQARSGPWDTNTLGHYLAVKLVLAEDRAWLESRPLTWWREWSWYLLRNLDSNEKSSSDEVLALLKTFAQDEIRSAVIHLSTVQELNVHLALSRLLEDIGGSAGSDLDSKLCELLEAHQIPEDRMGIVGEWLVSRNSGVALASFTRLLESSIAQSNDAIATRAAVMLLSHGSAPMFANVISLLTRRPDLAPAVLESFASDARGDPFDGEAPQASRLGSAIVGELVTLLFAHFPPHTDAVRRDHTHPLTPTSAREYRQRFLNFLSERKDASAVAALRALEARFGTDYPRLSVCRARAERAYRQSLWHPLEPTSVSQLLASASLRLVLDSQDAAEGVEAALNTYGERLRKETPNDLEDLWNRPKHAAPSPKEEERVSDKVCGVIREYFEKYAVAAEREVQLSRRLSRSADGGAPGSRTDVLCRIPGRGTTLGDRITVPVEVKWAHNPDARSGLEDQLVTRYLKEAGTECGIYVVVWAGRKPKKGRHALWKTLAEATLDLTQLAKATSEAEGVDLRLVVIDASLPRASQTTSSRTLSKHKAKRAKRTVKPAKSTPARSITQRPKAKTPPKIQEAKKGRARRKRR